jgi:hypothetical protein
MTKKEQDLLLSDEEIFQSICSECEYGCKDGSKLQFLCKQQQNLHHCKSSNKAQLAKCQPLTRQQVLKEVGEWLDKNIHVVTEKDVINEVLTKYTSTYGLYTLEWWNLLNSLKQGQMPKGE